MKIALVTPALPYSRTGNRATAIRWKNILSELGHQIELMTTFTGGQYNAMVALHSWRSAESIRRFNKLCPEKPLIVALTGTDLYKFIKTHPKPTLHSIKVAHALVALHGLAYLAIPQAYHKKLSVIYQSAKPIAPQKKKSKYNFDVCVIGHLREEKDSLRAAYAVRKVPGNSRIRIKQYGKAHTHEWGKRARQEMKVNSRYRWYGEVPHWQVRKQYASADLMVLSSKMEGGANVISEACVAGLPTIASDIVGSIGLLGEDYPGYYAVGSTGSLRRLLLQVEADNALLHKLHEACSSKARLFTYTKEKNGWRKLLEKFK